jgi:transposase
MPLRPDELEDAEKKTAELLCRLSPEVRRAQELALSFVEVVKERDADGLRAWIIHAQRGEIPEFKSLADGLTADLKAVRAAPSYEWSNGQMEGQVHRLKSVKRQMCGRGCSMRLDVGRQSAE